MRFRSFFKRFTLFLILVVSVWLLIPPAEEPDPDAEVSETGEPIPRDESKVRYTIKFSPGYSYKPGSIPFGFGDPLEGLQRAIRAFERRFPDTRIDVLDVPGRREYLVTQLSSGSAPDIVNVNVEDVWVDVQKDWYIPLDPWLESPNPFIAEKNDPSLPGSDQWWDMFKYQAISRGKAAPDNKMYCISYDMIETGIYYNKTVFKELGLEVPETWPEFMHVMEEIEKTGNTPLMMHIDSFNDWLTDLLFDQLYFDLLPGIDIYQDPVREDYLEGYLDWDEIAFLYKKGFFGRDDPRYVEIWRIMKELKQYTSDDMVTTDFLREFVNQRGVMLWSVSSLGYRLAGDPDLGFEWGVFYLPRLTKQDTPYASGEPMCVIGGSANQFEVTNSAIGDTDPSLPFEQRIEESERLKRVMLFLQFLCVPEYYEAIVNEYPALISNIRGVGVLPILEPFERILERRYTTTKWIFTFDLRFSEIQKRMLMLYLQDKTNLDEFMDWQERNVESAVTNLLKRKEIDMDRLERKWDALAPIRAEMEGLPSEVREESTP